jgi:hypothetical protein
VTAQPLDEAALLNPDFYDALANAGMVLHFAAANPDVVERFARFMEHGAGDLDAGFVARWMRATHDVLSPGCPMDWPGPADRAGGVPLAHGES